MSIGISAALGAEVERLRHDIERHIAMASDLATENERLRAELEECKQDAERYRWLKPRVSGRDYRNMGVIYGDGGEGIDEAIDAALAGEGDKQCPG